MASIHLDKHGIYAQLREKHTFPRWRNCITCSSLLTPGPCVYMNFQKIAWLLSLKAHANAHNIVMLRAFAHHVVCCYDLLEVVGWRLKLVKLQSQQVPTFLFFRGHRSVVQQCCIRLHSTSNNVAPAHVHQRVVCMELWVFVSQRPLYSHLKTQHVVTCCERLHTSANIAQQETTLLAPTMFDVVVSVCTGL